MVLQGDMNLLISQPSLAHVALSLSTAPAVDFGGDLQFKQHPQVAKWAADDEEKVVRLKDPKRAFPIGQSLAVLKWRYSGKDETYVPLSSTSS